MTKKKILRNSRKSEKEKHKAAAVEQQAAETRAEILAHMTLRPTVQAAVTMMEYNRGREISIETLAEDLRKECELASNGDFVRTEALLLP